MFHVETLERNETAHLADRDSFGGGAFVRRKRPRASLSWMWRDSLIAGRSTHAAR